MIKKILNKLPRNPSSDSSLNDQGVAGSSSDKGSNSNPACIKSSPLEVTHRLNHHASYEQLLPSFHDVPTSEKPNLFIRKLNLCCLVFDFNDPSKNLKEKEVKRQTLLELADYVTSVSSEFNEFTMQEIIKMIASNLFRPLPSSIHDHKQPDVYDSEADVDDDDDKPISMEPSWPHLQLVYELLLRFVASPDTDAKLAKRYIDHSFILRFLNLFESEDPRERQYLKVILHRIYGTFMVHRPFIRKAINNVFYQFIYETEKHNGINELLEILGSIEKHNGINELFEILGSIVSGFAVPLGEKRKLILTHTLVPLHKPKSLWMYHQRLSYCITEFVKKDFKLADIVIRGLLKYWPITNSRKEILYLGELEEVLESTQAAEFQKSMVPLFRQIGRCLNSSHFQVAERALFLWNNDQIRKLITQNRKVILPIIFPALEKNTRGHWNQAIQSLTLNVRKIFSDADQSLFDECLIKYREDELKEMENHKKREITWMLLEIVAASKSSKPVIYMLSRKLNLCCVMFDFNDPSENLKAMDVKRQTLIELVDYVSLPTSKFDEVTMQEITKMIASNLFRSLPSTIHDNKPRNAYDSEYDLPIMEQPSWSHLQFVYELLLRFVASPETDAKLAKRYINHSFISRLLDLFDSEDLRERKYLRVILHRIYGKFMVHRPFIMKAINNVFYQFILETEKHNGINELLEILGSIINGFAVPLNEKHKLILTRTLVPLHKPKSLWMYHQHLSYCITEFVKKDLELADTVIRGLLKYWPITNSPKEVLYLSELEEVLKSIQAAEFKKCMVPLFRQIGRCCNSLHPQVAERALCLWNHEHITNLIIKNCKVILPVIFPALEKNNTQGHWNEVVRSLTLHVRKIFSDADQALFDECLIKYREDELKEMENHKKRESTWMILENIAASKSSEPVAEYVVTFSY